MNAAHFHLVVNHLPLILPGVGLIVVLIGIFFKSAAIKRTALLVFVLGSLSAAAAVISGERAEDVVENMAGVEESYIERHEEAAQVFSVMSYILGGLSLLGLWLSFKENKFSHIVIGSIVILALAVMYFGKEAGTTGGEIRHPEIRAGYVNGSAGPQNHQAAEYEDEDDDGYRR
jgi:uncharacterized membrane protein